MSNIKFIHYTSTHDNSFRVFWLFSNTWVHPEFINTKWPYKNQNKQWCNHFLVPINLNPLQNPLMNDKITMVKVNQSKKVLMNIQLVDDLHRPKRKQKFRLLWITQTWNNRYKLFKEFAIHYSIPSISPSNNCWKKKLNNH